MVKVKQGKKQKQGTGELRRHQLYQGKSTRGSAHLPAALRGSDAWKRGGRGMGTNEGNEGRTRSG